MVLGKSPILNILWTIFVIGAFLLLTASSIGLLLGLLTNASYDAAQNKKLPEVKEKAAIIQGASQNEAVKQLDPIFLSLLTSRVQKIESDKQIPKQQQQNAVINPSSYQNNPGCFWWNEKQWIGDASSEPVLTECGYSVCIPCEDSPNIFFSLLTSMIQKMHSDIKQIPEQQQQNAVVNPSSYQKNPDPFFHQMTSYNPHLQYPSFKQIPNNPYPQYPFYKQMPAYNPYLHNPLFQQIPNSQGPSFHQMPYNPSSAFMPPAASPTTTTTQYPFIINGMQMPAYNPYLHNPSFHQIPTPYSQLPSFQQMPYNPSSAFMPPVASPTTTKTQYPFNKQMPAYNPYLRNPSFQQIPTPYSQLPSFQQMPYNPSSAYMPPPPTTTTTVSSTTPSDADIDDYLQGLEDVEPCIETLEDYEYVKPGKW